MRKVEPEAEGKQNANRRLRSGALSRRVEVSMKKLHLSSLLPSQLPSKTLEGLRSKTDEKPKVSRELSTAEFQNLLRQASIAERAKTSSS